MNRKINGASQRLINRSYLSWYQPTLSNYAKASLDKKLLRISQNKKSHTAMGLFIVKVGGIIY